MNYFMIPAALAVALLLTLIFAALFSGRSFWRGLFLVFLLIFLVGWSSQIWISPIGPVVWGISWLPLFFVSLMFFLLIIAAMAPEKEPANVSKAPSVASTGAIFTVGFFFWFLLLILIGSIVIGYYLIPPRI